MNEDLQQIRLNEETVASVYGTHAFLIKQGNQTVRLDGEGVMQLFLAMGNSGVKPPKLGIEYTKGEE